MKEWFALFHAVGSLSKKSATGCSKASPGATRKRSLPKELLQVDRTERKASRGLGE